MDFTGKTALITGSGAVGGLGHATARVLAAGGGGSIVNVSSTAAGLGMPPMAVYGATKAALESLTRTWAAEFAASNVRVNAVSPGPMTTAKVVAAI